MRILSILYNAGGGVVQEVPFSEISLNIGDMVRIDTNHLSAKPLLCKVNYVPICMLSTDNLDKI
jgi:hypothetical protein